MTYYLKYRSQTIDELDLTEPRESLKKILNSSDIPHAFLFAGPKGTGKTSAARILAKIVNCEAKEGERPCNKCDQCTSITAGGNIDVVEIDAASHRGIDDIRSLKETIGLAPARAKKKIYIIDEAHMLTTEAGNALLKTLEEPPSHTIFILATTNPEKLLDTVRSRATLIQFKKASVEDIGRSLARVVSGEKLKVEETVLSQIAQLAKGSFRDAAKLLEQFVVNGKLSVVSFNAVELLKALGKKDTAVTILSIENGISTGVEAITILESLIVELGASLLSKFSSGEDKLEFLTNDEVISLSERLSSLQMTTTECVVEQLPLEIALIKWIQENDSKKVSTLPKVEEDRPNMSNAPKVESKATEIENVAVITEVTTVVEPIIDATVNEVSANQAEVSDALLSAPIDDKAWTEALLALRATNVSLEALLRSARPMNFDGKVLTLAVFYKFHKEKMDELKNKLILEEVFSKVLGSTIKVSCSLTKPPEKKIEELVETQNVALTQSSEQDIIGLAKEIFSN